MHRSFGSKHVNVKPIIKGQIPEMWDHRDAKVREAALNLTVELHRWLGKAVRPKIEELRPEQVKLVDQHIEKLPKETPKPEKWLRSEGPPKEKKKKKVEESEDEDEDEDDEEEEGTVVAFLDCCGCRPSNITMKSAQMSPIPRRIRMTWLIQ